RTTRSRRTSSAHSISSGCGGPSTWRQGSVCCTGGGPRRSPRRSSSCTRRSRSSMPRPPPHSEDSMTRKKKNILIGGSVVLVAAVVVAANLYFKKDKGIIVTTEVIKARDLEAVVSASGKIQPKRLVQISADTPGRVVNLAVNEGDRIKIGQFLLQ